MALLAPLLAAAPVQCVHECPKSVRDTSTYYFTRRRKSSSSIKCIIYKASLQRSQNGTAKLRETETICVSFYFSSIFF